MRAEGLNIVPQVTCRPLNFEYTFAQPFIFASMDVFEPIFKTDKEGRAELYRDAEFRDRVKDRSGPNGPGLWRNWFDRTVVSMNPKDPSMDERGVGDLARERDMDPVDLAFDLALDTDLKMRFRMAVMNYDEDEVAALISDPNTVIGLSDAGAHASQLCDACFSTYLLKHWVREKGLLSLEQAVHMLTAQPAELFGLVDRGRLAEGLPADVTVFDPETVGDSELKRVHDLPNNADRLISEASGIHAVIVNGTVLRMENKDRLGPDDALPGMLLRGQPSA